MTDVLRWFDGTHLPSAEARVLVGHFQNIAETVALSLAESDERDVALRKLLEAKDAAVRGLLMYEGAEVVTPPGATELEVAPECWHVWRTELDGRHCTKCPEVMPL